jgi:hypothetical protein
MAFASGSVPVTSTGISTTWTFHYDYISQTTTFSQSAHCSLTTAWINDDANAIPYAFYLGPANIKYTDNVPAPTSADCFPSGLFTDLIFYTPGICPSSWTAWVGIRGPSVPAPAITEAICCPPKFTGFLWSTGLGGGCTSVYTTGLGLTVTDVQVVLYSSKQSSSVTTSFKSIVLGYHTMAAQPVPVFWTSGDIMPTAINTGTYVTGLSYGSAAILSNVTYALSTASNSSMAFSSVTFSSAIPNPTTKPQPNTSGLTSGAKIGLGIGIPFGILLIIGVLFCLLRRRRSKPFSAPLANGLRGKDKPVFEKAELQGTEASGKFLARTFERKAELDAVEAERMRSPIHDADLSVGEEAAPVHELDAQESTV